MGKGALAAGGHYLLQAEGGTFPAETDFHRAGAGARTELTLQGPSVGILAPTPGNGTATPCCPAGARVARLVRVGLGGVSPGLGEDRGQESGRRGSGQRVQAPLFLPHLSDTLQAFSPGLAGHVLGKRGSGGGGARPPRRALGISAVAAGREGGSGLRLLPGGVWGPRAERKEPPSGAQQGRGCGCRRRDPLRRTGGAPAEA